MASWAPCAGFLNRWSLATARSCFVTAQDNLAVGNVNLVRFSDDGREAALGYWLVPAARGRGLATAAARLLCAWGFAELRLARIELAVLPGNASSQRVATRLGAVSAGIRRDSHHAGGRSWDMLIYSLHETSLR